MISHITAITSRTGTTYNVYHHRDYVTGKYTKRTYTQDDNLPDSVLDVLIGIVPSDLTTQYVDTKDNATGIIKIERYHVPVDRYVIDYVVPTAMGNWTEVRRYSCKDREDFARCVKIHQNGDVKILSVNGRKHK